MIPVEAVNPLIPNVTTACGRVAESPLCRNYSRYRTMIRLLLRCSGSIQCSTHSGTIRVSKNSHRARRKPPTNNAGSDRFAQRSVPPESLRRPALERVFAHDGPGRRSIEDKRTLNSTAWRSSSLAKAFGVTRSLVTSKSAFVMS